MQAQIHYELEDSYEHGDDSVEYILENALMPNDDSIEFRHLLEEYHSQLTFSCDCKNDCTSCCHGASYKYNDQKKELILQEQQPAIIECNDLCTCRRQPNLCKNRRVQYGPRKQLEVFDSRRYNSKGVRTNVDILKGSFICEYVGELLTITEARRRLENVDRDKLMNYILCLREFSKAKDLSVNPSQTTIVDPTCRGNIGRYLNHSCNPNCEILAVRINSPIPKIGIFAKRDIVALEELCFHYGGGEDGPQESFSKRIMCRCASLNCSGFMPNSII
ncbi:CG4565 [Drosophila busckii]|uniref:CG4565 n=1 Tax=Drosophila busckii TaxID=30019 RepID=A0A0M4EW52_DROBS|nr:probable histone-lysine N-methyltransferase set-23 [Drosophila busckii]ALC47705.1 CG4565 [Drosophila busckii]